MSHTVTTPEMEADEVYWLYNYNNDREANGVQVVGWSPVLAVTAENHNATLIQTDQFNHSADLVGDISRAGWEWRAGSYGWFENHGWGTHTTDDPQAIADRQEAGYLSSPSHFAAMMDPNVEVVGLDIMRGDFAGNDADVSTMHFGWNERNPYIEGVIYDDLNNDGNYDIGEGLGGSRVQVTEASSGEVHTVIANSKGFYQIEVDPNDTYSLVFTKTDGTVIDRETAVVGINNVEVDSELDTIVTPPTNQTFTGTSGNNVFVGGAGDDVFISNGGIDTFTGGAGADTFKMGAPFGPGSRVTITDFDATQDILDFSAIDANSKASGNQAFTWSPFTTKHKAGELWMEQQDLNGNGVLDTVFKADTGNQTANVAVILDQQLTPADFTVGVDLFL